ncbi:MAG: hypothetical protein COV67_01890 [Nitrospinae bacterium CG11_big_fil_rev_8_21_14_0_20_56_8]|nr:MAG: hypothetical protein COV67_01890 [Nitrospinae bacterium CG11_big_fil_rev_8_21_14_0_20_56_8]
MTAESLPFGMGAMVALGVYIVLMLAIGAFAYTRRQEESLGDFYLAGRSMGLVVLLLTLYATQYSGNTLLGFSGAAYREGFGFLVSVHFMTAIIVCYLLFAPRLYRLSREREFITPGDFIQYRFRSRALKAVVTVLMVYAACNFTLAQMKTMGTAFETLSGGKIPLAVGVIGLAAVMLIYESLGGMRSVAWTDAVQGGILFVGFGVVLYMALDQVGGLAGAVETLAANPQTLRKVEPPDAEGVRRWISFILLVGLGAAIYPQAIQRVYAARDCRTLKRSLAIMAFLPLTTAVVSVLVGVIMAAHVPGLDLQSGPGGMTRVIVPSETVLPRLCLIVMQSSEAGYWLVVIVFASLLAAVMSTADSALLSISSMVTQDLYAEFLRPGADQAHLTRMGRAITWTLMVPIVWLALKYDDNLIHLLKIKFELLIQCVPAFYLGIHTEKLTARTTLWGIAAGLSVTLGLVWADWLGWAEVGYEKVWGFHSGLIGLAVNLMVCGCDFLRTKPAADSPPE